jgi:SAM-dependent methyltransferase
MYRISLPVSNTTLSCNNYEEFSKVVKLQTGPKHWQGITTPDVFLTRLESVAKWNWDRTSKYFDVHKLKKVIDVGSGIGIYDLTLHHLNQEIEFYLIDKSAVEIPKQATYYSNEHYFYNSWDVVNDFLDSSDVDKNKFNLLSPVDNWPTDVDLVISMHSWCWHYPKEFYWERLLTSLRIGGTLILDVLNVKDRNIVEEISEELGARPSQELRYAPTNHPFANEFTFINGSHGGLYSWVRAR